VDRISLAPPSPRTTGPAGRRALLAVAIGTLLLALLAIDVVLHGPLSSHDVAISAWAAAHRLPAGTALLMFMSRWHGTLGIDVMCALLLLVLLVRRRWLHAVVLLAVVQGGMLLNVALKSVFQRARPDSAEALVHLTSFSFPSGHALAATVWWAAVAWLCWAHLRSPSQRAAVVAMALLLVVTTAASRVYLGAHFLTDVLAGISEGVAWLGLCLWAVHRAGAARPGESVAVFGGPAARQGDSRTAPDL